ncbi:phage portal protein [Paracoccus sp. DMF-8]|uniref:phage portal protein n=1 Tax=Paracoccus sp. DMF-8 TaxID=3019445 RepID=UPI0023E83BE9|nr:phage portal protein [Paracoccus sp. DMF-8]MDF3606325.1 phage portal protein [Paracoccus sp. DMF-8]
MDRESVLSNPYIFRCQSMIARDIAKLRVKLVKQDAGIWSEVSIPAFSPVIRKPNHFQTRNQFWESYFLSKLSRGNTYVLKQRDQRGVVVALYVLDPMRVQPLISESGEVFYRLSSDNLARLPDALTVPAREIIHDRWNCLFHPLVGIPPLWANALNATQAQKISESAASFFANQSRPGGILTAPGAISDETAAQLKQAFEQGYSGENAGRIAVVGDGLTFSQLTVTANDSQLVEQLKWTAETIVATYGIPLSKLGLAAIPSGETVQTSNIRYYIDALHGPMEDAESCLDEGLGLDGVTVGVEFDTDSLWRLDSLTQMDVLEKSKSVLTLDERRKKLDAAPITGGATVYLQQQDHSIEAIAARDKVLIEQANNPAPIALPAPDTSAQEQAEERAFMAETLLSLRKNMEAA